jgi:hypothetical protein
VHLDPQIEGKRPQVIHLEDGLHLFLERRHPRILSADDHQVVDVNATKRALCLMMAPTSSLFSLNTHLRVIAR